MYQGRLKIFFFFLFFTYYILHTTYYVYAQEVSLAITPPNIVIQTQAPALIEKPLQIANNTDTTQNISITFKPFVASAVAGKPSYINSLESFYKKVEIFDGDSKIEELTLLPKQQKNLKLKIVLAEDQPNQDYYFSVIFISKAINVTNVSTQPQNVQAITYIQPGIAQNVLLSVFTGKKQPEGIVDSYKTPLVVTKSPVEILLTFQNTGSYLLISEGTVLITNMFGQTVGKIAVPKTYVLANSERNIKLLWNEQFLLGPYNATLYLGFSDKKDVYYKRHITFIGLPLAFGASIMALIIAIIVIKARLRKYRN